MKPTPPNKPLKFLRWFCREDCLEEIESDLIELFEVKSSVKQILGEYRFEHYTVETELDKETCGLKD